MVPMILKRFLQSLGVVSLLLLFSPVSAGALTGSQSDLPGANNASDYQPPTGNPQNDVGGVSQGQSNQNNLQKLQTVDQTALPNVPDLRVSGVTGERNPNTTKTEVASDKQQKKAWGAIALGVAAVAAAVLLLTSGKDRSKKKSEQQTDIQKQTSETKTTQVAEAVIKPEESEQAADQTESESTTPKTPAPTTKKTTRRKKGKGKGKGKKAKRKR